MTEFVSALLASIERVESRNGVPSQPMTAREVAELAFLVGLLPRKEPVHPEDAAPAVDHRGVHAESASSVSTPQMDRAANSGIEALIADEIDAEFGADESSGDSSHEGAVPGDGGEPTDAADVTRSEARLPLSSKPPALAAAARLDWCRALHRLARVAPVPGAGEVDLRASVRASAERDAPVALLRPRTAPVTQLIVMIDAAPQMTPFEETLRAVVEVARGAHCFARVDELRLDLRSAHGVRCTRFDRRDDVKPRELVSPGLDPLVLIVSDGLGPAIRSGALGAFLSSFPASAAVVWAHPWPAFAQPLTPIRELPRVAPLRLGETESRSAVHAALIDARPGRPRDEQSTPSFLDLEPWLRLDDSKRLPGVAIPAGTVVVDADEVNVRRELATEEWRRRVQRAARFLQPATQQLLGIAAAVPGKLNLSLLDAMARRFGVEATPFHFAEAMASGLLERDASLPDRVVLQLPNDDVRTFMLRYLPRERITQVVQAIIDDEDRIEHIGDLQIPIRLARKLLRDELDPEIDYAVDASETKLFGFRILRSLGFAIPASAPAADRVARLTDKPFAHDPATESRQDDDGRGDDARYRRLIRVDHHWLEVGCTDDLDVVWEGEDTKTSRRVWIHDVGGPFFPEQLEKAKANFLKIESEHVLRLVDLQGAGPISFIYEHVGMSAVRPLRELLDDPSISTRAAAQYALDACRAVQALHAAGVAHGDLGPRCFFLVDDDLGSRVMLLSPGWEERITDAQRFARDHPAALSLGPLVGYDLFRVDSAVMAATTWHLLARRPWSATTDVFTREMRDDAPIPAALRSTLAEALDVATHRSVGWLVSALEEYLRTEEDSARIAELLDAGRFEEASAALQVAGGDPAFVRRHLEMFHRAFTETLAWAPVHAAGLGRVLHALDPSDATLTRDVAYASLAFERDPRAALAVLQGFLRGRAPEDSSLLELKLAAENAAGDREGAAGTLRQLIALLARGKKTRPAQMAAYEALAVLDPDAAPKEGSALRFPPQDTFAAEVVALFPDWYADPRRVPPATWTMKAVVSLARLLRRHPDVASAHRRLGELFAQMGEGDRALAQYREWARLSPEAPDAWAAIVELDRDDIAARVGHAEALIAHGRSAEGAEQLRAAGAALREAHRFDDLLRILERVIRIDGNDHASALEAARIRLSRNDAGIALANAQVAFHAAPENPDVLRVIAECFLALGSKDKAAATFDELARVLDARGAAHEAALARRAATLGVTAKPSPAPARDGAVPAKHPPASRATPPLVPADEIEGLLQERLTSGDDDGAYVAAAILELLGDAHQKVAAFLRACRLVLRTTTTKRLSPATRFRTITHPAQRNALHDVLAVAGEDLFKALGPRGSAATTESSDAGAARVVHAGDSQLRVVDRLAGNLGINGCVGLAIRASNPGEMTAMPVVSTPGVAGFLNVHLDELASFGARWDPGSTQFDLGEVSFDHPDRRFVVGRALMILTSADGWFEVLKPEGARRLVEAVALATDPTFPVAVLGRSFVHPVRAAALLDLQNKVKRALSRWTKAALKEPVAALLRASVDLDAYGSAVPLTRARAGLLLAVDIGPWLIDLYVPRSKRRGTPREMVEGHTMLRELIEFALGDELLQARRELGVGLTTSASRLWRDALP